jgi:transcriptional regulator
MFIPGLFKIEDVADAHGLMRAHPFAVLVTYGSTGLFATHLPTVLKVDAVAPLGRIECHVARPNPQWETFARDVEALMIFQGPEAYIRPGWYPSKAEHGKAVPTWNYTVVHAYGRIDVVRDAEWLLTHVGELTDQQEQPHPEPWATSDAPASYTAMLARGIVGMTFTITRLEGKAKMSQNREPRDRDGVVQGLRDRAAGDDEQTATLVERLNP